MKPKVGFFDFAGCEGCQLQIINLEEEIIELASKVEIVNFREAISERGEDYDIAFVEGSITRKSDEGRLRKIREQAAILVALGACACNGGINALKNFQDTEDVKRIVYGDKAHYFDTYPTRPIDAVVPVDYYVRGCPISKSEFLKVFKALLLGKRPEIPNYPVCVECKMKENVCVFEKGMTCLGPVTRAGCEAMCPSCGNGCVGCRGLVDDPNINAQKDILNKYGLTIEEAIGKFRIFDGYQEVLNA
ncbi:MAG: NADH:ubiquinone oxidoreductase [Deltaproteobacteria bacterium]|nr:MAG: NADH:ubiquinone oxidoreductase [Deltaproteobacteria bacterium]